MKKISLPFLFLIIAFSAINAQVKLDSLLPVRGFCIAAPNKETLDPFIKFIREELVPRKVNTLVLRVDWGYEYKSHPELRGENPLTEDDVKKIVAACKDGNIRVIPQVNLLGHQSWFKNVGMLLRVYPEFSETPWLNLEEVPDTVRWPNKWGLYCLSYCPLHPEVHKIVFELIDEITEAFEATAFHAGMDEVFYLGDEKCPRCSGRDHAELFAYEVTTLRNHLALSGKELWIWGDRLIDGKTTGLGIWEASYNNTHRAIDLIPKDVVINDWHYRIPVPTPVMFAMKGFRVITCPWNNAEPAIVQTKDMVTFRQQATPATRDKYYGMMQTVWTGAGNYLDMYYGRSEAAERRGNQVECFKRMYEEINKLGE